MSGGDDPFGRDDDEQTDAFGRPLDQRGEERTVGGFLPPTEAAPGPPPAPAQPPEAGGFLPPTDRPPERDAWWAEPAPPVTGGGYAPAAPGAPKDAAEWVERAGAALIDGLIRFAVVLMVGVAVALATSGDETAITIALLVTGWGVMPFYAPLLMARWDGQTVGHRAVNTRIVRQDGSRLSGGGAVVREVLVKHLLFDLAGAFVTVGVAGLINYLWPLWDERNEALHDKMCNTRVVKV